jgi:hypothetical protein
VWWINKLIGGFPLGSLFCFYDEKTAKAVCRDLNRAAPRTAPNAKDQRAGK